MAFEQQTADQQVQAEPQSAEQQVQGDPEQLAQGIMQQVEQLKQMVPEEIFAGFIQQLSTGGQPQPEPAAPQGPVPGEGGVGGQPRL